ncbi:MAG: OmpA family protein [Rickettsiales bacterium]|jgi:outer membrane protein OmpA-like peptidoglycan-associated protein|nr:OmpA family protein [Rickettsiales bacterium]
MIVAAALFTGGELGAKRTTMNAGSAVTTIEGTNLYSGAARDKFANYLATEYKSYALFQKNALKNHDEAEHFAKKALAAYHGERPRPDGAAERRIPESHLIEVSNATDDVIRILNTDIAESYPALTAELQVKYDCWIENVAKGRSIRQTQTCYDRFMRARDLLLEKLALKPSKCNMRCKREAPDAAKDMLVKENIRQFDSRPTPIPAWPNVRMIENNPPQTVDVMAEEAARSIADIRRGVRDANSKTDRELADIKLSLKNLEIIVERLHENGSGGPQLFGRSGEQQIDIDELKESMTRLERVIDAMDDGYTRESRANIDNRLTLINNDLDIISAQLHKIMMYEDLPDAPGEHEVLVGAQQTKVDRPGRKVELASVPDKAAATCPTPNVVVNVPPAVVNVAAPACAGAQPKAAAEPSAKPAETPAKTEPEPANEPALEEEAETEEPAETAPDTDEPEAEEDASEEEDATAEEETEDTDTAEEEPEEGDDEYTTITQEDYFEEEVAAASSLSLPYELNFEWNKDNVQDKYVPDLEEISKTSLVAQASVIIQGHTDTTGTQEYNSKLSRRRANNVAQIVEASGISHDKIIIQAMGETDLKVQTADNVMNEANRRVVVK